MAKGKRTFRVKYNNWAPRDTEVAAAELEGKTDEQVARKVMGVAFAPKLPNDWPDDKNRRIVMTKAGDGMYEGQRFRDEETREDKKVEDWYIMETTPQ